MTAQAQTFIQIPEYSQDNRVVAQAKIMWKRYQQRRALMNMPEYLLRDIGMTKYDVAKEVRKPFWQA
ncbi:DUF1127 domain-containing protein [Salinispirillum marinum]|uniref:DUF1127 domain-containing protein n=2 Tax=Saccharospirillaceae TaxID=255527 RepID=A0ABV8BER7_9GAMM